MTLFPFTSHVFPLFKLFQRHSLFTYLVRFFCLFVLQTIHLPQKSLNSFTSLTSLVLLFFAFQSNAPFCFQNASMSLYLSSFTIKSLTLLTIIESLALEGTSRIIRQDCQPLDQVLDQIVQGPIQPSFVHLQEWGIYNLSEQPIPTPHLSLSKKHPLDI